MPWRVPGIKRGDFRLWEGAATTCSPISTWSDRGPFLRLITISWGWECAVKFLPFRVYDCLFPIVKWRCCCLLPSVVWFISRRQCLIYSLLYLDDTFLRPVGCIVFIICTSIYNNYLSLSLGLLVDYRAFSHPLLLWIIIPVNLYLLQAVIQSVFHAPNPIVFICIVFVVFVLLCIY